jgi:hypothetical protein
MATDNLAECIKKTGKRIISLKIINKLQFVENWLWRRL